MTPAGVVVSCEQGLLVLDPDTGDITDTFAPDAVGGQGATFTLLPDLTLIATPTAIVAYGPPNASPTGDSPSPRTRPATQPDRSAPPPPPATSTE